MTLRIHCRRCKFPVQDWKQCSPNVLTHTKLNWCRDKQTVLLKVTWLTTQVSQTDPYTVKSRLIWYSVTCVLRGTFSPPPGSTGVWVKHCIKDRYDYYYNLETGQGTWEEPEGFEHNGDHLTKEEIQVRPAVSIMWCYVNTVASQWWDWFHSRSTILKLHDSFDQLIFTL